MTPYIYTCAQNKKLHAVQKAQGTRDFTFGSYSHNGQLNAP